MTFYIRTIAIDCYRQHMTISTCILNCVVFVKSVIMVVPLILSVCATKPMAGKKIF